MTWWAWLVVCLQTMYCINAWLQVRNQNRIIEDLEDRNSSLDRALMQAHTERHVR